MKTLIWYSININEKLRGQGWGGRMYEKVEKIARDNSVMVIIGNIYDKNTPKNIIDFFLGLGLELVKKELGYGPCQKFLTDNNVYKSDISGEDFVEDIRNTELPLIPNFYPMDTHDEIISQIIEWKKPDGQLIGKTRIKIQEGDIWEK